MDREFATRWHKRAFLFSAEGKTYMRSRNIKPGFFENEQLGMLPLGARILFIGLWCLADREGLIEFRPLKIKIKVFPYDDITIKTIKGWLHDLAERNLITLYQDEYMERLILINNFKKHQRPHKKEAPSELEELLTKLKPCDTDFTQPDQFPRNSAERHDPSAKRPDQGPTLPRKGALIPDTLNTDILNTEEYDHTSYDHCPDKSQDAASKKEKIPYKQIVDMFNNIVGSNYKHTTKATQRLIRARWNEGFRVPDFEAVIKFKYDEWHQDEKYCAYIRPQTLFSGNFEAYLQNATRVKPQQEPAENPHFEETEITEDMVFSYNPENVSPEVRKKLPCFYDVEGIAPKPKDK